MKSNIAFYFSGPIRFALYYTLNEIVHDLEKHVYIIEIKIMRDVIKIVFFPGQNIVY